MLVRTRRALRLGALITLGAIACAPATTGSLRNARHLGLTSPLTPTSRVIDGARIQRSGSHSALDAIRTFVPGYRWLEARPLDRGWVGSTARPAGALRVVVDGHPVPDAESLGMIPARDILAIHVLNANDAIIRFGPSFSAGAIVIQTVWSLRSLD